MKSAVLGLRAILRLVVLVVILINVSKSFAHSQVNFSKFSGIDVSASWRPSVVQKKARIPLRKLTEDEQNEALSFLVVDLKLTPVFSDEAPKAFATATKIINAVYSKFQKTYPAFMANKVVPDFFVFNGEIGKNHAIVAFDDGDVSSFGFLYLSREMLEAASLTFEEKAFIIAHEMAHIYLGHNCNTTHKVGFSDKQMTAAELVLVDTWTRISKFTGVLSSDKTDIAFIESRNTFFGYTVNQLLSKQPNTNSIACSNANALRIQIDIQISNSYSDLTSAHTKSSDTDEIINQFLAELVTCLKQPNLMYNRVLFSAEIEHNGKLYSANQILTEILGKGNFNLQTDSHAELIIRAIKRSAQMLSEIESKIDLSKVRVYKNEDQADDMAALVMKSFNPTAEELPGSFAILKLVVENEEEINTCVSWINEGQVPAYGDLFQDHRSGCFRYLNINTFTKMNNTYLDIK